MSYFKDRISSPLEAGTSLLYTNQYLPPALIEALEYVSERLSRRAVHVTLVLVSKEYELPCASLPSVSYTPASTASPAFAGLFRTKAPDGDLLITVDISNQLMTVKDGWRTIFEFDVSTGRKGYTTPTGNYRPIRMHKMWYSSKYENSPMPWSIFFHGGYAIHGTEDIKHLGQIASHGCVRLHPNNAEKLYELVDEYGMKNAKIVVQA